MTGDRIVAVGLLTANDLLLLGQGFRRLFPVPRDGNFGVLLDALDRVNLDEEVEVNSPRAADQPSDVTATNRQILVDGPGGVAITFTIPAARETGRRLCEASDVAETQAERDE